MRLPLLKMPHAHAIQNGRAGHTGRFITLAGAAWHRSTDAGFGERAARDLEG